jgi:cytochrome c553
MSPSHTNKDGARYRYYVSQAVLQRKPLAAGAIGRVPAAEIEVLISAALRRHLQANGTDPFDGDRELVERRERDPAKRLVFAGDPQRGIPPCSACHGPGGFKIGAPALQGQHAAYLERQLAAFAQGIRQNDIYEQMRAAAKQLTPDEMQALAAFYGTGASTGPAEGLPSR